MPPNGGHRHTDSVSQNHKAQLASAYNELGKELSSSKIRVVGNYTLGKAIGEGAYGKVRIGVHRLTGTRVAIKQIPKAMSACLTREIHHHRQLHHPHVTQLYEVIATESNIWLVTELCSGGELFDYLAEKGRLAEDEVRLLFGQLCLAIAYVHEKGIVHRDLKLENVLLDERCRVKLGDFGFTREFERGTLLETFCGTTGYAAPEMLLAKKYLGPEVDIWSLGVILYTLLTGTLPFDDDDDSIMREKVIIGEYEDPEWLSDEARDLIKNILVTDPNKRLSISQILAHSWFTSPAPLSAAPSSTFNFASPSPLPSPSFPLEPLSAIEIPPTSVSSVTSDSTFHSASCEFPSTPTTPDEGPEGDVFLSAVYRSSQSTLKTPVLNLQDPSGSPTPGATIFEEGSTGSQTLLDPSSSRPSISRSTTLSNHTTSSKNPPSHPTRTPARTKRRSISSTLSDPASPTASAIKVMTPQDFSSMLHTPAPIIFSTSLDRELLNSLSTLGFDTGQIVHSVLTDACDATGALWWMLRKKAEKKAAAEPEKDVKQSDTAENGTHEEFKHSSRPKEGTEKDQGKVKDGEGKHRAKGKSSHEPIKTSVTSPSTPPPHSPIIAQARSAPELQFIPPTPTAATSVATHPPSTPPRSKSPSSNQNDRAHSLLSPISTSSLTDSINAKSYSSTPGTSLKERDSKEGRDKDKDSVGSKGRKARAGSVSIMQRATTALEAAGLVRKKSNEAVKEEKEREREREKSNSGEKRQGSGDEPRASHGSGSNKAKSPPLRAVKDSSAPGTPPPNEEGHSGVVGSPWVFANLKSSPPSTPASSHGDTLGALPNISEHGSKLGGHRNRASLLTTFRMWFREDPKGKRKESAPQLSTQGLGYNSGNKSSPSASPVAGHSRGTVKRRPSSGNRGKAGGTGRRSGNRGKRGSVSSRRSSSVNSKRSSLTSTQMAILENASTTQQQYTIPSTSSAEQMTPMTRQRSDPSRRSFGSHTPNSERDEYVSRPSSIQSFRHHHRHRKSPSASSAGSGFQVGRTNSPLPKYHRKTGSGSSTRVVRQVAPSVAGKHHAAAIAAAAHLRSNSASSNHSLASSRHNSVYELSETEGRRASSPRKSLSRSSFDDGNSTPRRSGATTFVAQKRHTPLSHPNNGGGGYLNSLGRSSWKKSWGREPPGWQTRSAHPSIEVLAILPAAGDVTASGGGAIRDVFTGRQSFSMGDESDWVDEDDDVSGLVYAGGLGQLPISTPNSNSTSTTSSSMMMMATGTHSQTLDSPMISPPPARNMFIRPPPTNSASSKRGPGGLGLPPVNTTGRSSRSKSGGRSPAGRSSPLPNETTFEATETRGGRRQIPNGRSGPAFRQAIQEEDEDEEE